MILSHTTRDYSRLDSKPGNNTYAQLATYCWLRLVFVALGMSRQWAENWKISQLCSLLLYWIKITNQLSKIIFSCIISCNAVFFSFIRSMKPGVTIQDLNPQPLCLVPAGVAVISNRHFMWQANSKVHKMHVSFAQRENVFPVPTDWYLLMSEE